MPHKSKPFIPAIAALAALVVGSAASAAVYPLVTLDSFNAGTFTYMYKVDIPANSSYAFGYFQVDAQTTASWTLAGPIVSNVDQNWASGPFNRAPGLDSLAWRAFGPQEVPANTAWLGYFKIVAPNTAPVSGFVLTHDGISGSANTTSVDVPGVVPEPSGLLALATGMIGLLGLSRKR